MRVTATPRPASFHAPPPDVGDAGRRDGAQLLELRLRVPEVVEEASTVTEHHRNDVELKFVQQSHPRPARCAGASASLARTTFVSRHEGGGRIDDAKPLVGLGGSGLGG